MALIPPKYKPCPIRLKLAEKRRLTDDVLEFVFEPLEPRVIEFEPGQFINIDIPSTEKRIVRSYSISSNPLIKETVEICVKLVDGPGSHYLGKLKTGEEVNGSGPFGIFSMKDDYNEDMLFVATGTGVAPMKSMIGYQIERNFHGKMRLIFGVRHEKDVIYDELFNGIAAAHPNIDYTLTLSRAPEGWHGKIGRVTDRIKESEFNLSNLRVFICGNGDMIREVSDMFKKMGLPEDKIHHEKFY